MPTSRLPVELALVPDAVIELARTFPIYCNLRAEQRPPLPTDRFERINASLEYSYEFEFSVDPVVSRFLRKLHPNDRVVIHFQGYGSEEIGTMVVRLNSIYWRENIGEPRLDFEHPEELKRLHGCPNFWGSFILAIGLVTPMAEEFCLEDKDAQIFIRTVKQYGIDQSIRFEPMGDEFSVVVDGITFGHLIKDVGFSTSQAIVGGQVTISARSLGLIAFKADEVKTYGKDFPVCPTCGGTPNFPGAVYSPNEGVTTCQNSDIHPFNIRVLGKLEN